MTTMPTLDRLFGPETIADPYPLYKHLRENMPVFRIPNTHIWVLTRYQDVQATLRDKRLGHPANSRPSADQIAQINQHPAIASLNKMMLVQDPPVHTRLRALVVKAFDARRTEAMRPRIQAIANRLIDRMIKGPGGDLVAMFNHPLPVIVICEMLGIPKEDQSRFTDTRRVAGRILDPKPMSDEELVVADAGALESQQYFDRLFARRQQDPQDDLLTALVESETEHGKLSKEELSANVGLLFGAGHETTANLLGNALLALFRNPEQLHLLRRKPELTAGAADEFLRYDSSVQLTGRGTFVDYEIGGHCIPKDHQVLTMVAAANRDPERYRDPDQLDIERRDIRPLSFGGGIHYCLGAQLARIEIAEALKLLLERLPNLRLVDCEHADWKPTITLRGLKSLPATW